MKRLLNYSAIALFLTAGAMTYAYVFDVEPLTAEKVYAMERDIFLHSDENWHSDFPCFNDWITARGEQEARFNDWLAAISREIGIEAAITLDPWYQPNDTTVGHAGSAPDNWAKGERD